MTAPKSYWELTDYELSMLDLAWEELRPGEPAPDNAEGWREFYESFPDELKPGREEP